MSALCAKLGLDYFTSPYSVELVHQVEPFVAAYKLGSGDITWHEVIATMASYPKPLIMATGASTMQEVEQAMAVAMDGRAPVILLQCNTEYSASPNEVRTKRLERYRRINLRVIESYRERWPSVPMGLSDHTQGATTVLGAVGLFDCCIVEKHFTLDSSQEGQDHAFSMTPTEWKAMVDATAQLKEALGDSSDYNRRLEITRSAVEDPEALDLAIGDGVKILEDNELNTVVVQRRALRLIRPVAAGEVIKRENLIPLRPCPAGALAPSQIDQVIGMGLKRDLSEGECLMDCDLTSP